VTSATSSRGIIHFGAATLVLVGGVSAAAMHFPGGYDWIYMVVSKLGSRSHNPTGALWLSGSLLIAVCLLWPVTTLLAKGGSGPSGSPRFAVAALRIGLLGGGLLALEGAFALELSRLARKGHEVVALLTFLGLYTGVLGLYVTRLRQRLRSAWPALMVVVPLCAVALSQITLYFDQRDLGWVNTGWREMGIPFWLSFAFWQWSAIALLGAGLGYLIAFGSSAVGAEPAGKGRPN